MSSSPFKLALTALSIVILTVLTIVIGGSSSAFAFEAFDAETSAISNLIKCPNPKITQEAGLPDLWGCIWPGAEVVKVFVNEANEDGQVENVKVMWNDWTRDTGYGVHTDKAQASAWLSAIATRYAPESVDQVLAAYSGDTEVTVEGPAHRLTYTYWHGPAIDERLITIIEK